MQSTDQHHNHSKMEPDGQTALEAARDIDVVIFDKTGTLTKGERGVVAIRAVNGTDTNRALAEAAAKVVS